MTLGALQRQFQQHVLSGGADIASVIRPGGIGIERRLAIYHHAYRARLVDTLRDSYGHTLRYLGDDAFDAAALVHVEAHPSDHPNLRWYGRDFPQTLAARFDEDPEVAELALLDWTLRHAFDGPDAPVLTLADLAAVAPEAWGRIGFVLHPTFTRLQLHHNTLALWQAMDEDETAPPAAALAAPGELLVWRRGHQPHFRSLQPVEVMALDSLHDGTGFAAMCALLAERFADVDTATEAGTLLRRWIDEELLSAIAQNA